MRRVMRTSFTIALATVMIGLAVSQARADRVSYSVDRCFDASCLGGSVRVGELSLAFTESSLGVVDSAASATALANFSPELFGISGVSFAGSSVKSHGSDEGSPTQRASTINANPTVGFLPASGMGFYFSRLRIPAFATSIDLGRSVSNSHSASFSVTGVALNSNKVTRPYWATNQAGVGGGELPPGGAPNAVPEPTTMLLLGTGLVGFAAVARKRLRGRRDSK